MMNLVEERILVVDKYERYINTIEIMDEEEIQDQVELDKRYNTKTIIDLLASNEQGYTIVISDPCYMQGVDPLFTISTSCGDGVYEWVKLNENTYNERDMKLNVGVDSAIIAVYLLEDVKEVYPGFKPKWYQSVFHNIMKIEVDADLDADGWEEYLNIVLKDITFPSTRDFMMMIF